MKITSSSDKVLENLARDVDHLQNSLADRKLHLQDIKFSKENSFSQHGSAFMNFQDRSFAKNGAPFEVEAWQEGKKSFAGISKTTGAQGWSRANFIPAPTATSGQRVQIFA
jgi:hypothetical protein